MRYNVLFFFSFANMLRQTNMPPSLEIVIHSLCYLSCRLLSPNLVGVFPTQSTFHPAWHTAVKIRNMILTAAIGEQLQGAEDCP